MRVAILSARAPDDGHVGLRRGLVVESDGILNTHDPS
jgi:hypothetical protein